jgi:hypothetical protein
VRADKARAAGDDDTGAIECVSVKFSPISLHVLPRWPAEFSPQESSLNYPCGLKSTCR